jgi:hypothetical protein
LTPQVDAIGIWLVLLLEHLDLVNPHAPHGAGYEAGARELLAVGMVGTNAGVEAVLTPDGGATGMVMHASVQAVSVQVRNGSGWLARYTYPVPRHGVLVRAWCPGAAIVSMRVVHYTVPAVTNLPPAGAYAQPSEVPDSAFKGGACQRHCRAAQWSSSGAEHSSGMVVHHVADACLQLNLRL